MDHTDTANALRDIEKAIENALIELQLLWGHDEGDDPELLNALVKVRKLIKEHTDD